jgi:hypothetical protein
MIRPSLTTVPSISARYVLNGDSSLTPPKIKLPDCIIRATAESQGRIIVTRNPYDFGGEGPKVRVPYELDEGVAVNIRAPLP